MLRALACNIEQAQLCCLSGPISQHELYPVPRTDSIKPTENRLKSDQTRIFLVSVTLVVNCDNPLLGLAGQQIHLSMQLHPSAPGAASAHSPHVVVAGPTTYRPSEPSLAA